MTRETAQDEGVEAARAADFPYACHVISLERTPQRFANFRRQNAAVALPFEKFAAADGEQISQDDAIRRGLIKPGTTWRTKATIGVAQSHRSLWEKAVAEDRPLVIFEDDTFIRHDFARVVPPALAALPAWDIVLFGSNSDALVEFAIAGDFAMSALFSVRHPSPGQLAVFARSSPPTSVFPLRHAFGLSSYAVTPAGAGKLLKRCFPMDNRVLEFKAAKNRFNAFSLDGMMNAFYSELAAYVFVAPVALPHNDWQASTVDPRART